MGAHYLIRFDDVYDGMPAHLFASLQKCVAEHDLPAILGVTPFWEAGSFAEYARATAPAAAAPVVDKDVFWEQIRRFQDRGCEIALHGCRHVLHRSQNLIPVNPYGEFAGLDYAEQVARLARGKARFEELGLRCRMLMPPAHAFDRNTLLALQATGIPWVTDGKCLYPYRQDGLVFFPQISSSLRRFPAGIITICIHPQYYGAGEWAALGTFVGEVRAQIISTEEALARAEALPPLVRSADSLLRAAYLGYLRRRRPRVPAPAG
jgi:peptidoglycan/xylan/chitin deacetylase (PgdA/CDA1 family)